MKWDMESYFCAELDEENQRALEQTLQEKTQLLSTIEQHRTFFLLLQRQGLRKKIKDALNS